MRNEKKKIFLFKKLDNIENQKLVTNLTKNSFKNKNLFKTYALKCVWECSSKVFINTFFAFFP